jgi:hypothetical protein
MKLVFYTRGDTRHASPPALRLTLTQLYERYAHAIGATVVRSATTDAEARDQIERLIAAGNRYDHIVFVGHGFSDGYFFSGQPHPQRGFTAGEQNAFDPGDTSLMEVLGRALTDGATGEMNSPTIEFHSCYTGSGRLLPTLQGVLDGHRTRGHLIRLLGYSHYFRWSPVVHPRGHAIAAWQNAVVDDRAQPHRVISGGTPGTLTPRPEVRSWWDDRNDHEVFRCSDNRERRRHKRPHPYRVDSERHHG